MKKIPTLYKRVFEGKKVVGIKNEFNPGCEEAFLNGTATVKIDGSCCAIIEGIFYKRYDAKNGKKPPEGAIPCRDPDPITGHHPHWVPVDTTNPADKWFVEAYNNTTHGRFDGTYEAIGPHFQGNPYNLDKDQLIPHGIYEVPVKRTMEDILHWLNINEEEGLVFWLNGEPVCKIKRTDFGLPWPVKEHE